MTSAFALVTRWWTAFALLASLALLGAAHAFERFDGLVPCNLCLKQRETYWAAVAVAGVATAWALFSGASRGTPRIAAFILGIVFTVGAVTAGFHAGGEAGWWSLPAACMAGDTTADLGSITAFALGTAMPEAVVPCDAVAWRWLGLAMAGWNTLIAAALAVMSLIAAKRPKDARAPGH